MRLNLAGQYFHRIASYDEDIITAQFPRLIDQDWNIDDFNFRITFRPKLDSQPAWRRLRGSSRGWALGTRLERQVEYRGEFGAVEANLHKSNWSCAKPRGDHEKNLEDSFNCDCSWWRSKHS